MGEALISVIVPVYNAAAYLDECLTSIIKQTHRKMEIFVIDDGSRDQSGALCDAYAEKDKRIHVIHKENGGVSSARNVGLSLARGDYIHFCDADDWVEPNAYETLIKIMETQNVDVCTFNSVLHDGDTRLCLLNRNIPAGRYNKIALLKYSTGTISNSDRLAVCYLSVTNKLFRKSACHNDDETMVYFSESMAYLEDGLFFVDTLPNWEQAYIENRGFYHRRIHPQSALNCVDKERLANVMLEGYEKMLQHTSIQNNKIAYFYFYSAYSRAALHYITQCIQNHHFTTIRSIMNRFCDDPSFYASVRERIDCLKANDAPIPDEMEAII